MPEFVLERGDISKILPPFDDFTTGYAEALFFTNSGDKDDELNDKALSDLSDEAIKRIIADCAAFQATNAELLTLAYDRDDYSEIQAGRDFWFTRCGHGVGFWDRTPLDAERLGDKLSDRARAVGNVDAYLGDDKKVYLS